jgi:hypothetical protein
MLIELMEPVTVRVPGDRELWHVFPRGTFGNYSSSNREPEHVVHKFVAQAPKHGFLTFTCVTLRNEVPSWL